MKEKYHHHFEEPLTEKQKNEVKSWRWLENMHEQRHHWVRAYLGKTFFAGMKSSQRSESKVVPHTVDVMLPDYNFVCTCANFENLGLLCKHILYLMKQKFYLKTISDRYILPRWTLSARYSTSEVGTLLNNQPESSGKEVSVLEALKFRTFINQVYERAVHDQNLITIATNGLRDIVKKFDVFVSEQMNSKEETSGQIASSAHETSQLVNMSQISVRDPNNSIFAFLIYHSNYESDLY
ncbi:hypothetical protein POM88_035186 [Heracleum sosnowskyi]|uniref:SWIM-type domain-containing protein n=1 Tax=Heracleum sosnowskyi TaxID=360622 RepID=A0AAD8MDV4_9APIA|nr:hypothetical protein POM88_035186 [Heracleum sosnowskyi]